ncbi:MAG: DNA methyltransferase [Armatimonadota bacterium]
MSQHCEHEFMSTFFGKIIHRYRQRAGLSRQAFARQIGVESTEVQWWEETGVSPEHPVIERIAQVFEMQSDELYLAAGELSPRLRALAVADPHRFLTSHEDFDSKDATSGNTHNPTPHSPTFTTALGELYHGDCLNVLPTIASRSVECVFADPPFNLGKEYGAHINDELAEEEYLRWCYQWIDEVVRVLKPGGAFFLYNLPKWNIHLAANIAKYMTLKHWIAVDIKFSLPISGRLYPSHYALLYFVKGLKPRTFQPPRLPLQTCRHCGGEIKDYGGYKDKMHPEGVNLTDVWVDIPPVRHRRYKNRAANELALKLLDRILDIATVEGDTVLDPFGGSGTTFAACELKGRRWIGCELGDCMPIIERIQNLDAERAQLADIRRRTNVLFTEEALNLRNTHGHDTSAYRVGLVTGEDLSQTQEDTNIQPSLPLIESD